jgi:CRP-like cAMP-binding protein
MAADIKDLIYESKQELILFHLLDDSEVDKVVPYLEVVDYPKGTTVFNEGDPGDFMGFITSGLLEVKKQTEFKGRQIVIAILGKGSFVGEIALIDHRQTRSATVVALENSELMVLRRGALDSIIEQYPAIAVKILKGLNQIIAIRMRKVMERLAAIF